MVLSSTFQICLVQLVQPTFVLLQCQKVQFLESNQQLEAQNIYNIEYNLAQNTVVYSENAMNFCKLHNRIRAKALFTRTGQEMCTWHFKITLLTQKKKISQNKGCKCRHCSDGTECVYCGASCEQKHCSVRKLFWKMLSG